MRNATFRQLRVFSEVARHLSFARAAEALHLTPPAVTMQVKELEAHVGLPLFDRSGRQVALTTAGEYMLVYARRMLATLKDAEDAAARLKGVELGQLVIGMVSTAKYFLPKLLAVAVTLILIGPWMLTLLTDYIARTLTGLPQAISGSQ